MTIPSTQLLNDREQWANDWAGTLQPVLYQNAQLHQFPDPVTNVRIRGSWDFAKFKIPLKDGDTIAGRSQHGVEILIEGQVRSQAGETKLSQSEMLAELEALRTVLDASSSQGTYSLFLFHDTTTPFYRKFKSCSTVRFEFDITNNTLFSYSTFIHSEDPTIYTTAPGL